MRRRRVAAEFDDSFTYERQAFLLLPGEGQRPVYDEYVISHRIAAAQREPQLGFAIPKPGMRYPRSSFPAQLLAAHAEAAFPNRAEALEDALYRAVFVSLEDVGDPAVLERCAETAGIPRSAVGRALEDRSIKSRVLREHGEAEELGIRGIPALVIPGQEPIIGAVGVELYRDALRAALDEQRTHR